MDWWHKHLLEACDPHNRTALLKAWQPPCRVPKWISADKRQLWLSIPHRAEPGSSGTESFPKPGCSCCSSTIPPHPSATRGCTQLFASLMQLLPYNDISAGNATRRISVGDKSLFQVWQAHRGKGSTSQTGFCLQMRVISGSANL